jgi:hypothetical protein
MNRWKSCLWMAAGAAALTVVGAFTTKPLLAQIRAAFVENVDEPGRSPYTSFATLNSNSCSGGGCLLFFAQVPAGKRLIVTSVTGQFNVATPSIVSNVLLDSVIKKPSSGSIHTVVRIPATPIANTANGTNMIGVSATLLAFFATFDQPALSIASDISGLTRVDDAGMFTLSGYLVDCSVSSSCAAIVQ